jgi:hypothetical protein
MQVSTVATENEKKQIYLLSFVAQILAGRVGLPRPRWPSIPLPFAACFLFHFPR